MMGDIFSLPATDTKGAFFFCCAVLVFLRSCLSGCHSNFLESHFAFPKSHSCFPESLSLQIFIIKRVKARVITCPNQPPTRGDNTISVAQGSIATPGATKQRLPPDRVFKRTLSLSLSLSLSIYIYIYMRQINYIWRKTGNKS